MQVLRRVERLIDMILRMRGASHITWYYQTLIQKLEANLFVHYKMVSQHQDTKARSEGMVDHKLQQMVNLKFIKRQGLI